jgi:hypothetical protein
MNRWLKRMKHPVAANGERFFTPAELKVFEQLPADQRNTTIQETFAPMAEPGSPPETLAQWNAPRTELLSELHERCFSGIEATSPLEARFVADEISQDRRLRILEYTSDEKLRFAVFVVTAADDAPLSNIVLKVVDDDGWQRWINECGAPFSTALTKYAGPINSEAAPGASLAPHLASSTAQAIIAPRGWGPNAWIADEKEQTHLARRFVLTGTTVDEGRIWDVRRAIATLRATVAPDATVTLAGRGAAAGIALYAAVFEPCVAAMELKDPPTSHRQGPILIDVLRVLDMPQALALAFPRRVSLRVADRGPWSWSEAVAKLYGEDTPLVVESSLSEPE